MTLSTIEHQYRPDGLVDFRVKTTLWIALTGVLFLLPFGVSNLFLGRGILGMGAIVVVAVLALLAHMSYRGRQSNLSLLLLPPVLAFLLLSVHEQGVVGVMWTYPGIVIFYFIFQERWAWVANALILVSVVPMSTTVLETSIALRAMVTLFVVSTFSIMTIRVISSQQRRLEEMAVTDSLTGLLNRALLRASLEQAFSRSRRNNEPAMLLSIDIDHFKHINDTFGHIAGDQVLTGVADLLRARLRATDLIFRTGGEEFVVVLSDTASEPGHHVAQLLRSAVAGQNLLDGQAVTVSVGVASMREDDTTETWFARADTCLYKAKEAGRNRVVTDTPLAPEEAIAGGPSGSARYGGFATARPLLRALPSR